MAERQIVHRKSSIVFSAGFPVVKWRSRSVAKSASRKNGDLNFSESSEEEDQCVHRVAYIKPDSE